MTLFSGVDWKSLTIPASLPITTDYFPDPVSLVNEYVVNEYDLVPEEILSDSAADRSPLDAKNSLPTNEEIFTELISQRLAQGFQLILLTPQVSCDLFKVIEIRWPAPVRIMLVCRTDFGFVLNKGC